MCILHISYMQDNLVVLTVTTTNGQPFHNNITNASQLLYRIAQSTCAASWLHDSAATYLRESLEQQCGECGEMRVVAVEDVLSDRGGDVSTRLIGRLHRQDVFDGRGGGRRGAQQQ